MLALSVRQPFADRIMRGTKRIEYRGIRTHIRGRVYVYASLKREAGAAEALPRGVIVGTVEIYSCIGKVGDFHWHLRAPKRLAVPRRPTGQPQPVWFNPFGSRATSRRGRRTRR